MTKTVLNPKTTQLEFFGVVGCAFNTIALPPLVFALNHFLSLNTKTQLTIPITATKYYLAWIGFHVFAYFAFPGEWANGSLLRDGKTKLSYKINAFNTMIAIHLAIAVAWVYKDGIYLKEAAVFLNQNCIDLCLVSCIFSSLLAVFLYLFSFRSDDILLSTVGNSGYFTHDFWMGRELNPRIFSLDLKYFFELRPGMCLWLLLNYSNAYAQYQTFSAVSNSMIFIILGQSIYIADALWFEKAILTTMDITTDGFGFMLAFGDLLWVPFTFSLQTKYLGYTFVDLPPMQLASVLAMFFGGYWIFRGSNGQKNLFRSDRDDPRVCGLEFLKTESGSRLLVGGWWGVSRHINYFGDWLMGLSWCLATGTGNILTYFYVCYFGVLLVHRALRDDHKCREKYRRDWERYCEIVRWRIIPYVY